MIKIIPACVLLCCLVAAPQAQAFQVGESCNLKSTRDGFVALRSGPSGSARRIHKLNPEYHYIAPTARSNSWVYVSVGSPESWDVPPGKQFSGEGYVKGSLIDWSSCSMAG
jgi:hypothetical protein